MLSVSSWQQWVSRIFAARAVNQAALVTAVFGALQVMRLGVNIVLAHLLSPAIFGVMALINSLRSGVELLTDVGVGQNIIVNPDGDKRKFYNTAWTVQVLRGVGLTVIGAVAAWPIAHFYGKPDLFPILLVCSVIFLLTGANSPSRFLLQRERDVRTLSLLDALNQISGALVSIAFAWFMPTVWGMTWALVVSAALVMVISYAFRRDARIAFTLDRTHLSAIVGFGKWIFLSSLIYFAATNFDRLYLPLHIPLALFGVYGISRSMSDIITTFMQRIAGAIVLPAVARERDVLHERLGRVAKLRAGGLALVSTAIGGGIAASDLFVTLAYDPRYEAAVVILPLLLIGTWFSVQSAVGENVLLGLALPSPGAAANFAKFMWTVILLPVAFAYDNLLAAFAVIALADVPRYLILTLAQHREGLRFAGQDVALLGLTVVIAVLAREAMQAIGWADGFISSTQWGHVQALLAGGG